MIYIDPERTWPLMTGTVISKQHGITGSQLFLQFWSSSSDLLHNKRVFDVYLCLLAICAIIKMVGNMILFRVDSVPIIL